MALCGHVLRSPQQSAAATINKARLQPSTQSLASWGKELIVAAMGVQPWIPNAEKESLRTGLEQSQKRLSKSSLTRLAAVVPFALVPTPKRGIGMRQISAERQQSGASEPLAGLAAAPRERRRYADRLIPVHPAHRPPHTKPTPRSRESEKSRKRRIRMGGWNFLAPQE